MRNMLGSRQIDQAKATHFQAAGKDSRRCRNKFAPQHAELHLVIGNKPRTAVDQAQCQI